MRGWLILAAGLTALAIMLTAAAVLDYQDHLAERERQLSEKLRVRHAQFVAEQRMQQLTKYALRAMLDAVRQERRDDRH